MRRIIVSGAVLFLLVAVSTGVADAVLGAADSDAPATNRLWCGPGLTLFRWVTPGRWHQIHLTAQENR
jgi:hypothetical protein